MKSTFSIIFYRKRQVVRKDGTVPVMGRITVDGTQAQFSCKTTDNSDLFDTKGGRIIDKSMQALELNRKLDKMRVSISKHYQEIMDRDNFVTADISFRVLRKISTSVSPKSTLLPFFRLVGPMIFLRFEPSYRMLRLMVRHFSSRFTSCHAKPQASPIRSPA